MAYKITAKSKGAIMKDIIKLIQQWIEQRRCGKIIINFYMGGITSYETRETFKPKNQ